MAKLIIESGPSRGKQFQLPKSGKFAIGRGDKSAVRIDDNMSSRVHCTISCQSDHWVVEDQNSLNGIRLNGEQVSSAKMVAGDLLQVGETLFSVSTGGGESLVGETIAGYQVEKRLGRGAMGTVYLAQQISLDRPVALKILAPRFAKDADFVRHFLHEARAAARLNHPNVVQVYDAGQDGDLHFMSMEFLDGGSLEELLQAEGPLEIERAVEIARDAALALAFAKQNQIVHRDIKPANLLLATDGTVKVCDLGIAADLRAASGGQDESAENKNQFGAAGSPRYMAPEQARGNQPGTPGIDYRADIYALGATLYRMIAGRPPFDGSSVSEIIRAKLESDPSPLRDFAPDVPPGLASAIHRMLAYEPDDRFEDGDEVFEALDESNWHRRSGGGRRRSKVRAARGPARPSPPRAVAAKAGGAAGQAAGAAGQAAGAGAEAAVDDSTPIPQRASPGRSSRGRGRRGRVGAGGGEPSVPRLVGGGILAIVALILTLVVASKFSARSDRNNERASSGGSKTELAEKTDDGTNGGSSKNDGSQASDKGAPSGGEIALEKLQAEFREGKKKARLAKVELVNLYLGRPGLRSQAADFEAEIDQAIAEENKAAAKDLADTVAGLLKEGGLVEADDVVEAFFDKNPDIDRKLVLDTRRSIQSVCQRLVQRTRPAIQKVFQTDGIDAAKAELAKLRAKLPKNQASRLDSIEEEIQLAEAKAENSAETVAQLAPRVRDHIARLEFAKASAEIEKVATIFQAASGDSAKEGAAKIQKLRAHVAAAKMTWEALLAELAKKARARSTFKATFAATLNDVARPAERRYRAVSVFETGIEVLPVTSKKGVTSFLRPILSASDANLIEWALDGTDGKTDEAQVRLGLGLLLTYRHGVDRGEGLFELQKLPEDEQRDLSNLLDESRTLWFEHRLASAKTAESKLLDAGKAAKGVQWDFVANEAAILIQAWSDRSGWTEVRDVVHDLFLTARLAALASRPSGDVFHAASMRTDASGLVRLTYDFSDEQQLDDFITIGGRRAIGWDERKKVVKVNGEIRFLHGNPFRNRLSITATVPKGGYYVQRPNINFALWTHDGDVVTPTMEGLDFRRWRPGQGSDDPEPKDYFVVGTGYVFKVDLSELGRDIGLGGRLGGTLERFLPPYLREPSLVILAAERGKGLHHTIKESIWDGSAGTLLRGGTVKVSIQMYGSNLAWKVNKKSINFSSSRDLSRLVPEEPHSGSFTMFTNGETVYISSLEIAGELDPSWSESHSQRVVESELKRLDPTYSTEREDP